MPKMLCSKKNYVKNKETGKTGVRKRPAVQRTTDSLVIFRGNICFIYTDDKI